MGPLLLIPLLFGATCAVCAIIDAIESDIRKGKYWQAVARVDALEVEKREEVLEQLRKRRPSSAPQVRAAIDRLLAEYEEEDEDQTYDEVDEDSLGRWVSKIAGLFEP